MTLIMGALLLRRHLHPLQAMAIALLLLGLLLEVLAGWPGNWLLQGTAWLLDGFYRVLEWLARWNPLSGREFLLWLFLAAVFAAGTWRILQGRRRSLVLAVAMPAVMLLSGHGFLSPRPAVNSFELQLLDVGQGLSAVVRTSDHLLIFDRCPPWRAKRRRVVPGSREATRDTRRAEGAKGDPKGASERGVQSYGRPVCSRNELAMLWRNAG